MFERSDKTINTLSDLPIECILYGKYITCHPNELRYELNNNDCISQKLGLEHICNEITGSLMISHQRSLPQPVMSVRREDAKSGYNPSILLISSVAKLS